MNPTLAGFRLRGDRVAKKELAVVAFDLKDNRLVACSISSPIAFTQRTEVQVSSRLKWDRQFSRFVVHQNVRVSCVNGYYFKDYRMIGSDI